MFPHAETACALREMDRKALLAEAELARLAKEAEAAGPGTAWGHSSVRLTALRTAVGAGLIRIGSALQGAPAPALPTSSAAD
jgi:hypothetical protein